MLREASLKTKRQPVVGFVPPEETLLFHLKKGMDSWATEMKREGVEVSDAKRELVWELLVVACEFLESGEERPPREGYRLASEIGRRLAPRVERREVIYNFRDQLLDHLVRNLTHNPNLIPSLMVFFMAVGDAIWEAYAERLRSSIRHEKRQRLTEQLRVAKRIQQHLLPKSVPQIDGFDFGGRLLPAEEVGGDYWSIKSYPEDGVVTMKLADVTGHGVGAATLVAAVKFISGGFYRGSATPQEVMERTNSVLLRETPSDILVTMIYGWLCPASREVRLVNAGHSPVFLANGDGFTDILPTGTVLGLHENKYEETRLKLRSGDILVFSSDGVVESGVEAPFGTDRLKEVVWQLRGEPAQGIADGVVDAVLSYDMDVSDDLSVVITKVL